MGRIIFQGRTSFPNTGGPRYLRKISSEKTSRIRNKEGSKHWLHWLVRLLVKLTWITRATCTWVSKCYLILPSLFQLLTTNRSIFAGLVSNQGQVSVLRRFRRIGDWILEYADLKWWKTLKLNPERRSDMISVNSFQNFNQLFNSLRGAESLWT